MKKVVKPTKTRSKVADKRVLVKVEKIKAAKPRRVVVKVLPEEPREYNVIVKMPGEKSPQATSAPALPPDFMDQVRIISEEIRAEVRLIFDMYRSLNRVRTHPFYGFSVSVELEHLMYAKYLQPGERFIHEKFDNLDSGFPSLPTYRAMLRRWNESPDRYTLTESDFELITKPPFAIDSDYT